MPMNILNLDELIPEERTVRYRGEDHTLHITSTESYLKVLKARKKLGVVADNDEVAQTEVAIELLVLALPTIPRADLMRLPLNAMMRLVEIVQGEMDLMETGMAADRARADGAVDVTPGTNGADLGESTLALSSPG